MQQGYTISDLHLFSNRSQVSRHLGFIQQTADQADLFVLNGDIFDFQWSSLPSTQATLDAATSWIEALILPRPHCQFVFLIGNHDAVPAYLVALETLSARHANLNWREDIFKLGDKLFLHGDALHGGVTSAGLATYRAACSSKTYRKSHRLLYEAFTHCGLAAIAHKLVTSRAATSRILRYLRTNHPDSLTGITHIYFGHTHNALANYQYEGFTFHNCGGPFAGMQFNVLPFQIETRDSLNRPQPPSSNP